MGPGTPAMAFFMVPGRMTLPDEFPDDVDYAWYISGRPSHMVLILHCRHS